MRYGHNMGRYQSAVIPYRKAGVDVEVLLITSRAHGRWVFPKGKIERGMLAHRSAAREAFEEAGVFGTASAELLGIYRQVKETAVGRQIIQVKLFPMPVSDEVPFWPEMRERRRSWFSVPDAVGVVEDDELRRMLEQFALWIKSSNDPTQSK